MKIKLNTYVGVELTYKGGGRKKIEKRLVKGSKRVGMFSDILK